MTHGLSDVEAILLVLAGLYLIESCFWLREGQVAFTQFLTRTRQPRRRGHVFPTDKGGLLVTSLNPLDSTLVSGFLPVSLAPSGAAAYVAHSFAHTGRPTQSGTFACWEDLTRLRVKGDALLMDDRCWMTASTSTSAARLGRELKALAVVPPAARPALIEQFIDRSFDPSTLEPRLAALRRSQRALSPLAVGLFIHLAILGPFLLYAGVDIGLTWLAIGIYLLMGLMLWLALAISFHVAYRRLFPCRGERSWHDLVTMYTSPAGAARAVDLLGRRLFELDHPLTLAMLVSSRGDQSSLAGAVLRDLDHPVLPICPSDDPRVVEVEGWFRNRCRESASAMMGRLGLNADELARAEPSSADVSYCPRCLAEFTQSDVVCGDCGGRALIRGASELPGPAS
jgi:hypothetical protein